jgi:hypothetical protein
LLQRGQSDPTRPDPTSLDSILLDSIPLRLSSARLYTCGLVPETSVAACTLGCSLHVTWFVISAQCVQFASSAIEKYCRVLSPSH